MGLFAAGVAGSASAGILDAPPLINGTEKGKVLYLMTGVTADPQLGTFVTCTSFDKSELILALEVFAEEPPSNPVNDITIGQGVITGVEPGETVNFEISDDGAGIAFMSADSQVNAGTLLHGSARVLSTGKKVMCTAGVVDGVNDPPESMLQVNMIVKKQKGD